MMGEMRVEIESSDLIFDTGETIPAQGGNKTDSLGTPDVGAGRQSNVTAAPFENGEKPSASEAEAGGAGDIEVKPIDENAISGLPITIELPDEYSDAPIAAPEQEAEAPEPKSAAQLSPFSDDGADPPVQVSTSEKLETKDLEFNVADFLDVTMPFADEETTDAISVSLGEDGDESAFEGHDASQIVLQQEQNFTEELALAGDAAMLSSLEILDEVPSPNMPEPKSAKPKDVAQPGIVPIAAPTGEGLSALAGSGPSQILDNLGENAPPDETERSAKAAPQLEKMPAPQANEQPAEPAPSATNETARIKVRIGDDLIENLTIEEVTAMVEDRRLLENHYIAHQFSENWIAASLAPPLRPIFEKVRAEKVRFEAPPPPSIQISKRGLFNGLFGRN